MANIPEKGASVEDTSSPEQQHAEKTKASPFQELEDIAPDRLNATFENPLAGIPKEELFNNVTEFCQQHNLVEHLEDFKKGALVSQNPHKIDTISELSEEDREVLRREETHKWSQPWQLYWLSGMLALKSPMLSPPCVLIVLH